MSALHIVLLALVQGIAEFLPISSSAHLILVGNAAGLPDQGPLVDVSLHLGTLAAVLIFFWRDIFKAFAGLGHLLRGETRTPQARLTLFLVLGSIPALLVGFALHKLGLDDAMRSLRLIAWTMTFYALALYIADRYFPQNRRAEHLTLGGVMLIGIAQALAFAPGTSRSGATITAARFLGLERAEAAKFSMLLAVPVTMAAGAAGALGLAEGGDVGLARDAAIAGFLTFLVALATIALFMRFARKASMTVFVVYRLLLAAALFYISYR